MNSKKSEHAQRTSYKQRTPQNTKENVQKKERTAAEKDGFRYDYDDSSDL